MLPRAVSAMKSFPFSEQQAGISYLAVQPVSWAEASVLERRFVPPVTPEQAAAVATDLLHEDYAYVFETHWDLWTLDSTSGRWQRQPSPVKFIVHGNEFERAASESGDIEIDLGLDSPFLGEELPTEAGADVHVQQNVSKLVSFSSVLEKNSGASGRLLWSDSDENLAQKLISRLQKLQ